jgi:hypothetical protein
LRQTINDDAIEAEARSLLRKQLWDSAWYPNLSAAKRKAQIEQDVERYWHLKVTEAGQALKPWHRPSDNRGTENSSRTILARIMVSIARLHNPICVSHPA